MSTLKFFNNLKVLDLSTVLAGPSVGTFFAELGAEVIKVEHPENSDVTRSWKLASEKKTVLALILHPLIMGNPTKNLTFPSQKITSDSILWLRKVTCYS